MTFDEPVTVYNLEVEDFHAYFVTDTDVLVHNAGYDDDTPAHKILEKTDGKTKRKFPSEFNNYTINDLMKEFNSGGNKAKIRTALKILKDLRFTKGDNRK